MIRFGEPLHDHHAAATTYHLTEMLYIITLSISIMDMLIFNIDHHRPA